jgi:hypothetical protein
MIGLSGKLLRGRLSPVWPGPGTNGDVLGTTAGDEDADELPGGTEDVLSGAEELLSAADELLGWADELLGGTGAELSGADEPVDGGFDVLGGADALLLGGTEELVDGAVGAEEAQDTQNTLCLATPCSPVNVQKSL